MKTKNVYVYLVRDRHGWLPAADMSLRDAVLHRKNDIATGYTVSPIVKVAVPLPGPEVKHG